LDAQPVSNLLGESLIADQVARRGNDIGLPPVGVVPANKDRETGDADFRSDPLGEFSGADASLTIANVSNENVRRVIPSRKSEKT
jgi:hypothetical protein